MSNHWATGSKSFVTFFFFFAFVDFYASHLFRFVLRYLTVTRYEVCEVEIEFPDGDVDVIGIYAQTGLRTFRSLLEPLTIRRLQWNCLEEDHHDEVQSPDLN